MGSPWRAAELASCTRRLVKRGSLATKSASGRRPTKLAKAASISRRVLALTTSVCSLIARAAGSTSRSVVSETRLTELTITATRATDGTSSRRSSSRFAVNSPLTLLTPVRLPPGRARLATRPSLTGIQWGCVRSPPLPVGRREYLLQSPPPVDEPNPLRALTVDRFDFHPSGTRSRCSLLRQSQYPSSPDGMGAGGPGRPQGRPC